MKLPRMRDLTPAQTDVYLYAPGDRHVLVEGPPGTGKTLIACLRAIEQHRRDVPVRLGMYNRVLVQYASNVGRDQKAVIPVSTVDQWFRDWWQSATLPPHPQGGTICIQATYEDRHAVRAAGARWSKDLWRPWEHRTGVWTLDYDTWAAAPASFATWRLWQQPPRRADGDAGYDWKATKDHLIQNFASVSDQALNLGTFLIDEGQDFAYEFYRLLNLICSLGESRKITHPLRCFVLADENQQITESNSTLKEIREALKIPSDHHYRLRDNFRNTTEIAELARQFFADVGNLPELPQRHGEKPLYTQCPGIQECVQKILKWAINHPGKEVAVLVFRDNKRDQLYKLLRHVVGQLTKRPLRVQSYSSKIKDVSRVQDLRFDEGDVITVINMQSCKGLEFDAVFIVDLNDAPIGTTGADRFRMQMFVAVSRGRDWVQVLESDEVPQAAPFLKELPGDSYLERQSSQTAQARTRPESVLSSGSSGSLGSGAKMADDDWVSWAWKFAEANRWKCEDLRPKGCFWIFAPAETSADLGEHGFRYTERRKGWWRV